MSGEAIYYGLYPFIDTMYKDENKYHNNVNSVLKESTYERTLNNMEREFQKCWAGPVILVPPHHDIMLHTINCKKLHDYLNKDQWDMKRLEKMLEQQIGKDIVEET